MWTPRRIVLVVAGVLLFGGAFTVYAMFLGWIDGLPPLPEVYTHEMVDTSHIPEVGRMDGPIDTRLKLAFGSNCLEVQYKLKFEAQKKGLLFAAQDYKQLDDGRVRLDQVSVAIFGKGSREISTVHADRAFLTCDKPIRRIEDMSARKVVAAELVADSEYQVHDVRKGFIHITNNRRTTDAADDILVKSPGPIYYLDEPKPGQPHIWSLAHVELTDKQNRPSETSEAVVQLPTVTADGLRIYLTDDPPPSAGAPKKADKKNAGGVSGVERIDLDRNVVMNLWTESRNMFGGDAKEKDKDPQPKKKIEPKDPNAPPPEKVLVKIRTNGPFNYDMIKDKAHFEMPPPRDPNIVEYVTVTRKTKGHNEDTLTCDYLDVQFKRRKPGEPGKDGKSPPPPPVDPDKPTNPENDLEIETIHAWGKNIAMSSDEESLFAYGFDLFYDANIKQTVLKGAPVHAVKDGNLIRSPELILANLDDKEKQHARARGPGQVGMGDIDPKTHEHSRQAHWNDWLVVQKVKEHGRNLDLITLTGGASFADTVGEQMLSARQLKLWLLSRDDGPDKDKEKKPVPTVNNEARKTNAKDEKKQPLPFRLEATGDVTARSPELIVHKTEYLNTWFKDLEPAGPEQLPNPRETGMGKETVVVGPMPKTDPKLPANPKIDLPLKKAPAPGEKRDPPIEIRYARRIETWVNRTGTKNDLDKAHTEGAVVVHQDPTAENEKGVDIAGHAVDLEHYLDGNYLIVTGNDQNLGEVHLPEKLSIVGDDIRIDQRDNTATVKGWGSMRLMSKTDLEGKELEKPTWIDVHWKDSMKLEGPIRFVGFNGGVTAKQNAAKVLCESMQVWLDRPLYLNPKKPATAVVAKELPRVLVKDAKNPKGKEDKNPKVVKVLCDQQPAEGGIAPKNLRPVFIEDVEMADGKLVRYQNVQGIQVDMDNPESKMTAIGPGSVRMFQAGAKDPLENQPMGMGKNNAKNKQPAKADEEMKLTWVVFDRRMIAYNKMPKRAIFFSDVEVVHMPADRHDAAINVARLPERAMHLKCRESLEVVTRSRMVKDAKGKEIEYKWQEMVAKGDVRIRNDEFDGWAGVVTYSEDKSLVVLTGTDKNPAVLNKTEVKGGERKTFRGAKITYNVKTKDFSIDESVGGGTN